MEDQGAGVNPLAVTHLLQHTLRSLCIHDNSQWVYAVFWRILPRNYPPPKWDLQGTGGGGTGTGGAYDHRSRGNRRNWILVWEDGFCNFGASGSDQNHNIIINPAAAGDSYNNINNIGDHQYHHHNPPPPPATTTYNHTGQLLPEVFFKMSHEIYNYGEGLIGKVAADHSHKWIYKEPNDQEINFLSAWQNSADSQPRAWEAQFHSGIKTIALIAVREGVLQLGGLHKVIEDLSYVVSLRKKFSYIGSIPGVLLPHPSSSSSNTSSSSSSSSSPFHPYRPDCHAMSSVPLDQAATWHHHFQANHLAANQAPPEFFHFNHNINNNNNNHAMAMMRITPSMSSLEALLSKLPSVVPPPPPPVAAAVAPAHVYSCHDQAQPTVLYSSPRVVAKEEKREREEEEEDQEEDDDDDEDHKLQGHEYNLQSGHERDQVIMGYENNSSCLSSYDHLRHDDNFGYHFHHHHYNSNNNNNNNNGTTTNAHHHHHHDLNVSRTNGGF